jgi:hypothetical protein
VQYHLRASWKVDTEAVALKFTNVFSRSVLNSLVGMVDDTRTKTAPGDGHVQCFEREGSIQPSGDSITDYPPRKGIQDRCQIDKAGPDADVGDIGHLLLKLNYL